MGIADFTMLRAMSPTFRERQHMASMNELFVKHGLPKLRCRTVGDTYEWYAVDDLSDVKPLHENTVRFREDIGCRTDHQR